MVTATPETEAAPELDDDLDYQAVRVDGLRIGTRLRMPIQDERSVLLLSEGQLVTESFLENIQKRGLTKVKVHASELSRVFAGNPQGTLTEVAESQPQPACNERNRNTDRIDELLLNAAELRLPPQGEAFAQSLVQHGATSFDESAKQAYVERQSEAIKQIDATFDKLLRGEGLDIDGLSSIADEAMADLQDDMDLFASLGVNPFGNGYPARHSMHASMLAVAIGTRLRLDRPTLKELSLGCLIHDSGMMMVDQAVVKSPKRLPQVELLEITKHPVRIFDKMLEMRGIPNRSAYISYQMHERPDGTGYPRNRKKEQIHFLSQIASVADVYVALVAPRTYREGILPYVAMQTVSQGAQQGKYDQAAVQALLRTLSAYPLGSYVQMSDGRVGQVIRSNDMEFERPVVEVWSRTGLGQPAAVVDLSVELDLKILGPLASLTAPFDPNFKASLAVRELTQKLSTPLSYQDAAGTHNTERRAHPRRSFQTEVTVYVPKMSSHGEALQWHSARGISRNISNGGLALVSREDVRPSKVLVAFDARMGTRLCVKAQIVRRNPIAQGLWEYGLQFQGRAQEPLYVEPSR